MQYFKAPLGSWNLLTKLKFLNARQTSICYELLFLIYLLFFFFQYLQVPECWKVWAKSIWRTRSYETSLWEGNNLKIKLNIAFFSTISLRKKWNILKMNPLFFLERGIFLSCKQSVQIKKTILFYFFLFNRLTNLTVHHLPSSSFISSTWKFVAGLKLNNCALGGKKGKKHQLIVSIFILIDISLVILYTWCLYWHQTMVWT